MERGKKEEEEEEEKLDQEAEARRKRARAAKADREWKKMVAGLVEALQPVGQQKLDILTLNIIKQVISDFHIEKKHIVGVGKPDDTRIVENAEARNWIREWAETGDDYELDTVKSLIEQFMKDGKQETPEIPGMRHAIKEYFAPQQKIPNWGELRKDPNIGFGVFVKKNRNLGYNADIGKYGGRIIFTRARKAEAEAASDKVIEIPVWNNLMWIDGDITPANLLSVGTYPGEGKAQAPFVPWTARLNHQWEWPKSTKHLLREQTPRIQAIFANILISPGGLHKMNGIEKYVGVLVCLRDISGDTELTLDYGFEYWGDRTERQGNRPQWYWGDLKARDIAHLHKLMEEETEFGKTIRRFYMGSDIVGEPIPQEKKRQKEQKRRRLQVPVLALSFNGLKIEESQIETKITE